VLLVREAATLPWYQRTPHRGLDHRQVPANCFQPAAICRGSVRLELVHNEMSGIHNHQIRPAIQARIVLVANACVRAQICAEIRMLVYFHTGSRIE